jgi:hypothetical protein
MMYTVVFWSRVKDIMPAASVLVVRIQGDLADLYIQYSQKSNVFEVLYTDIHIFII